MDRAETTDTTEQEGRRPVSSSTLLWILVVTVLLVQSGWMLFRIRRLEAKLAAKDQPSPLGERDVSDAAPLPANAPREHAGAI